MFTQLLQTSSQQSGHGFLGTAKMLSDLSDGPVVIMFQNDGFSLAFQ
jgi:hypothetical protein